MDKNIEKQDDMKKYQISVEGSLGLLAYGDIGLRAWREVKKHYKQNQTNEKK